MTDNDMNAEFTAKLMAQNVDLEALVQIQADRIAELTQEADKWCLKWHEACERIAELEKQLAFMEGDYPEPTIAEKMKEFANLEQSDKIAELEKKSEVMAYIYQDPDTLQPALKFANPTNYWATVISTPDIPLYTTPHHASDVKQTKPLSDEEIIRIWNTCETDDDFEQLVMKDFILFARAIEAKVRGQ